MTDPERASPWSVWMDHAVDYADDVADGLLPSMPPLPKARVVPPKPVREDYSTRKAHDQAVYRWRLANA